MTDKQAIPMMGAMNFKALREKAGLTQAALAQRARCEQTTISQIETGRVCDPRYSTVEALAKALKTTERRVARAIAHSKASA